MYIWMGKELPICIKRMEKELNNDLDQMDGKEVKKQIESSSPSALPFCGKAFIVSRQISIIGVLDRFYGCYSAMPPSNSDLSGYHDVPQCLSFH